MKFEPLSNLVIGVGLIVHKALGPGLLESSYEACMAYELKARGCTVERQKPLPLKYKGVRLDCGYRLDLVVNKEIVLEIKAMNRLEQIHEVQMLTYLKLSGHRVGLIMNFNVIQFKGGLKRIVY
jgi:GxxExxY protein